MINKINRLNFSAISSKLNEKNINNNTEIPEINNKANFQSLINDFKTSYRTNRYWSNGGNYSVSLPEKSMTIEEQLEKPIINNIDYNIFGVRPQLSISFTKSNINHYISCLTVIGSTVIGGSGSDNGLYYSEDNGKTWNRSNITIGYFHCLTVIGSTVIAGSYYNTSSGDGRNGKGLYYSEDNGHTWNRSNITIGTFSCLTVIGSTVIAGGESHRILYYSEDNGHTWQHPNIQSDEFKCLTVIGSTVIAGGSKGLYYSEDNGKTWNQSNITSDNFSCLTVIGSTVIAGGSKGLYYSEDNGKTWNQSNITSDNFSCLTVIGSTVIAGGDFSDKGLFYSEDNGHTWQASNITSGYFYCLTVIGSTVIAGGKGLYYSEDNGHTWQASNITSGGFRCLTVIVSKFSSTCTCIAGSQYSSLFYTESISEPLEFKEEREDALEFLNSPDPTNEPLIYNSILSKLFLDWLDYTLVKDCSLNTKYTKYKDEAIVKESIDDNILTNNRIVYGNGPYFRFTDKYKC